ncbi:hypothetical protein B566_EDAN007639 [Ephemera danica]|nr:hypothetical protein B566_EDAN007639 [Ephemera danica]
MKKDVSRYDAKWEKKRRLEFKKYWKCQRNDRNKTKTSKRNTSCNVTVSVTIKKNNRHTRRNDSYLRGDNPLPCIVHISGVHNHSLDSADAMRYLHSGEKLKSTFIDYFSSGMSPSESIHFHKNTIHREHSDSSHAVLANSRYNPLSRTVYRWHSEWKNIIFDPVNDPMNSLSQRIPLYQEKGNSVGSCSCPSGACSKHQFIVQDRFGNISPTPPVTTVGEARYVFGKPVLEDACSQRNLIMNSLKTENASIENLDTNYHENKNTTEESPELDFDDDFEEPPPPVDLWPDFIKNIERLRSLASSSPLFQSSLEKMNASLKSVTTEQQGISLVLRMTSAMREVVKPGGKIKVQPKSISLRRPTAKQRSKGIAEGRPLNSSHASRLKRSLFLS